MTPILPRGLTGRLLRQPGPLRSHCLVWQGAVTNIGYGCTRFKGRSWYVHRLAWELTVGPIPDGLWVLHHCDNRPCCNIDHLYVGTALDNMRDRRNRGRARTPRGEDVRISRLRRDQVHEIRDRYAAGGIFQRELAAEYGVSQSLVSRVISRSCWAWT